MKSDDDKLKLKHQKASKKIGDLKRMLDEQNEELERAYQRLNDKDNEIRELKRRLFRESTIQIHYACIVESYRKIIEAMK